jgi:hypothetical protein
MPKYSRLIMAVAVLMGVWFGALASTAAPLASRPPPSSQYLPLILAPGAQSANEYVAPYTGAFQYGLNPGYYGNGWDDSGVYALCFDAGCRSVRNTLPDAFIAQWGTNVRLSTFTHAAQDLNFREITTFLQEPRAEWRDPTIYDGYQSKLWQGMDTAIWDSGENGTPVNDANRFALYVWTIVNTYGPYIRFYEIINEPDYTASSFGWAAPGTPGSWWENPPQAKDLPNIRVPIYQYIRLLRIAYAVIHRYDADAYVTPGGLGYPAFLDALLRYTDNPSGGTVTPQYPLAGGAYFDALSFHSYPQFGTRHWNGQAWVPDRHSDKAAQVLLDSNAEFAAVLATHGYAGSPYPRKVVVVTELNVPRKPIGATLGGVAMQRNFTIKALVKAQQAGIRQIYWYATGETANYASATDPFTLMGFYENLTRDAPGQQLLTEQGIANRTTFQQLYGWAYDAAATQALSLPATVDGAAFRQGALLRYVLWAKTTQDQSEAASATLSLPGSYQIVSWDGTATSASGTNLALTGAPVFLTRQP